MHSLGDTGWVRLDWVRLSFVDNFNISIAPRERDSILTNKQLKCVIAMI